MRLVLKPSISVLFGFTFKKALFSAFLGFNSFKIIYKLYFLFQSVKISFSVETESERWQKNDLIVLMNAKVFMRLVFSHWRSYKKLKTIFLSGEE